MAINQQVGRWGEDAAIDYLNRHGYRVISRNWRPGHHVRGELDCVAWQGKTLCFIEVKARCTTGESPAQGRPGEAVHAEKQRRLSRLAAAFMARHHLGEVPCRFDVVEVLREGSGRTFLALHQNAFEYVE